MARTVTFALYFLIVSKLKGDGMPFQPSPNRHPTVTFCPKTMFMTLNLSYALIACSAYLEPSKNAVSTEDTDGYHKEYCQLPPWKLTASYHRKVTVG